jgi:hypothetical protein
MHVWLRVRFHLPVRARLQTHVDAVFKHLHACMRLRICVLVRNSIETAR